MHQHGSAVSTEHHFVVSYKNSDHLVNGTIPVAWLSTVAHGTTHRVPHNSKQFLYEPQDHLCKAVSCCMIQSATTTYEYSTVTTNKSSKVDHEAGKVKAMMMNCQRQQTSKVPP
jgi:hypothetical protein